MNSLNFEKNPCGGSCRLEVHLCSASRLTFSITILFKSGGGPRRSFGSRFLSSPVLNPSSFPSKSFSKIPVSFFQNDLLNSGRSCICSNIIRACTSPCSAFSRIFIIFLQTAWTSPCALHCASLLLSCVLL